ncbi:MAG: acetyl-CoA carboxylase biotin carboxyl carrier protein [Clostridia bacterium]|nr:acetyl-CoA carboxylase biotin carboxyl carrier protein [Clostridia bacterium]
MEYEKIKKLMDDMGNSKLTDIDIEFPDGTKISMKKEMKTVLTETVVKEIETPKEVVKVATQITNEEPKAKEGILVNSPMVGNFYTKPSPDSEPYVQIGKRVKKGDILCIIEAMKLMNEIESEFDGEIVEILAEDGKPVEYGKPLFRIK